MWSFRNWIGASAPPLRVNLPTANDLNQGFSNRYRQKSTKKSISWSARAASRWILEKLKEDKERKVLRVQASDETLEGSGSKDPVSNPSWSSSAERRDSSSILILFSNQTGIQRTTSRSGTVADTSGEIPEIPFFFSAGT